MLDLEHTKGNGFVQVKWYDSSDACLELPTSVNAGQAF